MVASKLQDELKKQRGFDSIEQEAMLSVLKTSDLLENRLAKLLRLHQLTPSQYNVLRILRGQGEPMPMLEIADRMIQVAPAITRVVDQLIEQGWVEKSRSADDGRVFLIELTKAAKSLLKKVDAPLMELHKRLMGNLPDKELSQLIKTLARVRKAISD